MACADAPFAKEGQLVGPQLSPYLGTDQMTFSLLLLLRKLARKDGFSSFSRA